jgi:hypothetical protein
MADARQDTAQDHPLAGGGVQSADLSSRLQSGTGHDRQFEDRCLWSALAALDGAGHAWWQAGCTAAQLLVQAGECGVAGGQVGLPSPAEVTHSQQS